MWKGTCPRKLIVYSMGVVDYFLDNVFLKFVKFCLKSVKKGGRLILASCSINNPEIYLLLTWYSEWNFFKRDPFLTKKYLSENLNVKKISIRWEKNYNIFFLVITK